MSFTKVAPAGIGTEPGTSILIGDSLLHSTGIDIGSNTGIGVTIRKHGDATFTGIITASAFFGDGSGLEGVSSSGIGTPLSDDDTSDLNKVYYVNQELSIGSTVTVNHPSSAVASYTHYQDLVVKNDADFIVSDGDTFIPDVLGIRTSTSTASAATGGRIRAGTITNAGANGAPNFPNGLTGTAGTFTGNLNVAGVLTYEDVTNVDSVGVITARTDINLGDSIIHIGDTNTKIRFPAADTVTVETGGNENFRVTSDRKVGINRTSPTRHLHVYSPGAGFPAKFESAYSYSSVEFADNGTVVVPYIGSKNDHLVAGIGNTERLRITSAGLVGVGQATPTHMLHVDSSNASDSTATAFFKGRIIRFDGAASAHSPRLNLSLDGTDKATILLHRTNDDLEIQTLTASPIRFSPNSTERVRITSGGFIGVNVTSPQRLLHLVGNDGTTGATSGNSDTQLLIENAGGNGAIMEFMTANNSAGRIMFTDSDTSNQGQIVYEHNGDILRFVTAGQNRNRIDGNGNTFFSGMESLSASGSNKGINIENNSNYNCNDFF